MPSKAFAGGSLSTRRSFLLRSSGAALASALPKALFAQQRKDDLFSNRNLGAFAQGLLTKANFDRVIGSVFTIFYPDGSTGALTLLSVKTPAARAASSGHAAVAASITPRSIASPGSSSLRLHRSF